MKRFKTLFIALLFIVPGIVSAQAPVDTEAASVSALTSSGLLQLFTGKATDTSFQMFLQKYMDFKTVGNGSVKKLPEGAVFTTRYVRATGDQQPVYLTEAITYDKNNLIKKVTVTGHWKPLAELFLVYWPTQVNAQDLKSKRIAECKLITDKVTYQAAGSEQAQILITQL